MPSGRSSHLGDAHPWRPLKQPVLRFSVRPVAFRDVTQKPASTLSENRGNRGNGDTGEAGKGEEESEKRGSEGEENGETGHVTAGSDEETRDEVAAALIQQLGLADPRDEGDPRGSNGSNGSSDSVETRSGKKGRNSGKSGRGKERKKKGKPSKPRGRPSKRGVRVAKSDEDSEEWGKPWKQRRVGGSARSRRMVSNNQTGQSAYMCL